MYYKLVYICIIINNTMFKNSSNNNRRKHQIYHKMGTIKLWIKDITNPIIYLKTSAAREESVAFCCNNKNLQNKKNLISIMIEEQIEKSRDLYSLPPWKLCQCGFEIFLSVQLHKVVCLSSPNITWLCQRARRALSLCHMSLSYWSKHSKARSAVKYVGVLSSSPCMYQHALCVRLLTRNPSGQTSWNS